MLIELALYFTASENCELSLGERAALGTVTSEISSVDFYQLTHEV